MFNGDPESQNQSESSEMGEAADGTGTTQPTQQPAQDMSQVMQMMGQLITAQQNSQDAMLKLMADREASSSSRSITGLSSLARSVDARGVLRREEYHGDRKSDGLEEDVLQQPRAYRPSLGQETERHRDQAGRQVRDGEDGQ